MSASSCKTNTRVVQFDCCKTNTRATRAIGHVACVDALSMRHVVGSAGLALVGTAGLGMIMSGLARAVVDGLHLDDDAQWSPVRSHEQRVGRALRACSAAEGDEDAGV